MVLYTGCIYSRREATRGGRISIMSRHTLDDGRTSDSCITEYDEHNTALAPPPRLIGKYVRREISWEEYAQAFRTHLAGEKEVLSLAHRALREDITILCKEETPEQCHRRIVAEEAKRLVPGLEVIIR